MKMIFTLIFIVFGITVSAQQYSYRQYTIFDGLPQNQVMSLCVDSDGFLWVGTKGGIARFDGKRFVTFTSDNPSDLYVVSIINSHDDLYYHTRNSIYKLYRNKFTCIYKVADTEISKVMPIEDQEGLMIITNKRILKYTDQGVSEEFELWEDGYIIDAKILEDGQIIVSTRTGVYLWNGKTRSQITDMQGGEIVKKNGSYLIIAGSSLSKENIGKLFLYSDAGIKVVEQIEDQYLDNRIFDIALNQVGLINDYHTWKRYDENWNLIDSDSLLNNQINAMVMIENNLFLGTENGLYLKQSDAFVNYTEKHNMPNYIWTIFETDKNEMVFAAFDTKIRILRSNKLLEEYNNQNDMLTIGQRFYMDGMYSSKGEWVIPTILGIYFNKDGHQKFLKLSYNELPAMTLCTYEDTLSETLFFGTTQGVFNYNSNTNELKNIQTNGANVLDIEKDKYDRLWFCTNKKVFLFENDSIVNFKDDEFAVNDGVTSCRRDNKGNMWIAKKTGLYFHNYTSNKKIYDGSFTFISLYKDTYIIAGSTFGVLLVDLNQFYAGEKKYTRFLDRFNGFIGIECGQNGTCVDSKGNVWIPTSESVVKFMPEKLEYDTTPPKTFIYAMEYSTSDLKWYEKCSHPIKNDSVYNLDWKNNNLRITFHGIEYNCPERVKYKYRLKGYSDSWTIDSTEYVVFTNLDPGNYVFEVFSCNENGYWSEKPTIVQIHIVPAFWQTLIFKIAIILLSIFVVVSAMYIYMKRKRKQEIAKRNVEQQLVSMQMNTINAQLDPHFVFNAISAIGTEVQENNSTKAYDYYVKVSRLLRSSLIDKDKITRSLKKELDVVKDYLSLQQFRFGERIKFEINIAPEIDLDTIVPKMCIQIFVENAVKHGLENKKEGGEIKIDISIANNYLIVMILDNGIGRDAAAKINSRSTGTGLSAFTNFFEILNKYNSQKAGFTITDKKNPDGTSAGTEVRLTIPEKYKFDSKMG